MEDNSRRALGAVLFVVGIVLLYLLFGTLIQFVVIILELLGIVIAFALIFGGIGLLVWRPRFWTRTT